MTKKLLACYQLHVDKQLVNGEYVYLDLELPEKIIQLISETTGKNIGGVSRVSEHFNWK